MTKIWIVTGNFYWGQQMRDIAKTLFPKAEVQTFYRDYHFEGEVISTEPGEKPFLVISDNTCKTRGGEGSMGVGSYHIDYNGVASWARSYNIPHIGLTLISCISALVYGVVFFPIMLLSFLFVERSAAGYFFPWWLSRLIKFRLRMTLLGWSHSAYRPKSPS